MSPPRVLGPTARSAPSRVWDPPGVRSRLGLDTPCVPSLFGRRLTCWGLLTRAEPEVLAHGPRQGGPGPFELLAHLDVRIAETILEGRLGREALHAFGELLDHLAQLAASLCDLRRFEQTSGCGALAKAREPVGPGLRRRRLGVVARHQVERFNVVEQLEVVGPPRGHRIGRQTVSRREKPGE